MKQSTILFAFIMTFQYINATTDIFPHLTNASFRFNSTRTALEINLIASNGSLNCTLPFNGNSGQIVDEFTGLCNEQEMSINGKIFFVKSNNFSFQKRHFGNMGKFLCRRVYVFRHN